MQRFLQFFMLISCTAVQGQITQVSGLVTDYQSGEAIHGAVISDSGRIAYTHTNRQGYFSLGLEQGTHVILITAAGFGQKSITLKVFRTEEISMELLQLEPREADTQSYKVLTTKDYRIGHTAPLKEQVNNMPSIMSEPDPLKYIQMLPGVSGGIEGLAGLYVRGGNGDQNLNMMDGLPLYGNGHLLGFLSNYNTDQVRDMQFYRGVMPARYGGRASSALDVSMNDGNNVERRTSFYANPLALRLNMDGPLNNSGSTTGTFGIRRSWLDAFLPHSGDSFAYFNVYDINAKVVFRPSKYDKLAVWCYNGRDKYAVKNQVTFIDSTNRLVKYDLEFKIKWANVLAGVNYTHRFNPRHIATFLVGMSRYAFSQDFIIKYEALTDTSYRQSELNLKQRNAITDFTAKGDLEFGINSSTYLRYGFEATRHQFKPVVIDYNVASNSNNEDTVLGKNNIQGAWESAVYVELEKRFSGGLKLNLGGRVWQFAAADKNRLRLEPRIFVSQMLEGNRSIRASFGIVNQGVNQLANVNGNLPTDAWFPSSSVLLPQQSMQVTAGYFQPLKKGLEFSMEGYYKKMNVVNDLAGNDDGSLDKNYWENLIVQGKGTAYGVEALLMRKQGRLTGLVGYAFSVSNRNIPGVNLDKEFPFRWDRRHKFTLQGLYYLKPHFKLTFALVLMSGNAVSVPTGKYVAADGTFVFDYTEKNNFRMPMYKRFDIGFSKQIRPNSTSYVKRYWGVNIYNLFSFYNPLFIRMDKNDEGKWAAFGQSFFPIFPSAFYRWEF